MRQGSWGLQEGVLIVCRTDSVSDCCRLDTRVVREDVRGMATACSFRLYFTPPPPSRVPSRSSPLWPLPHRLSISVALGDLQLKCNVCSTTLLGTDVSGWSKVLCVFLFLHAGNKFLQDYKPWECIKSDKELCGSYLAACLGLVALLAALIEPYMPSVTRKVNPVLLPNPPMRSWSWRLWLRCQVEQ